MIWQVAEDWPMIVVVAATILALGTSGHAILHKREVRATLTWLIAIWLLPLLGALTYLAFGINRLPRRTLARQHRRLSLAPPQGDAADGYQLLARVAGPRSPAIHLAPVAEVAPAFSLVGGNAMSLLEGGDLAYRAMIEEIEGASISVALSTYIFDNDRAGAMFADALEGAMKRGVEVRVLIDGMGAHYTRPTMLKVLARRGIRVAAFLPSVPWRVRYMNLRNHRKILVVDGLRAFTGGMNIRAGCMAGAPESSRVRDTHFALRGPVVAQLMQVFSEDWVFTTGEELEGTRWFPPLAPAGDVVATTVPDGPDADFERLTWRLMAAVSQAQESIRIVSPYFLPEQKLMAALKLAAMRGVWVHIVLPESGNLKLVEWAARAQLWQLLQVGCRVSLSPAPFDHTKFLVVDTVFTSIGSANWDARSLRLNFELNVECYDQRFAELLEERFEERLEEGRLLTLEELEARPMVWKLRDGLARLFLPYL